MSSHPMIIGFDGTLASQGALRNAATVLAPHQRTPFPVMVVRGHGPEQDR